MKTNSFKIICMLIALITFSNFMAKSQLTTYSGNHASNNNTCTTLSGTTGVNCVLIGCGAGTSNTASRNTFIGDHAGFATASGNDVDNTAVGFEALRNLNGTDDGGLTAVGSEALHSYATGKGLCTAVGYHALHACTEGPNTAVGANALNDNDGSYNVAVGDEASHFNSTGSRNCTFGYTAGTGNNGDSYSDNSFFGFSSGAQITTGGYNTFSGSSSGYSNNTGHDNIFSGYQSGYSNTTGYQNVFVGSLSGYTNSAGGFNTFMGDQAGYNNGSSYNTFVGSSSGFSNVSGGYNSFLGYQSGYANTGSRNTFIGYTAANANTSGGYNTAIGMRALLGTTTGGYNTALGYQSGSTNTTGTYNTFIGYGANTTGTGNSNSTCLGNGASNSYGSNVIVLGNSSIATLYCQQTSITGISDRRVKENILENVPGLAFIKEIKPVTYNLNIHKQNEIQGISDTLDWSEKYDIENVRYTGFIAQQIDSAAQQVGYDFSGVYKPKNENDLYGLRYSDFVVPMVKAIQELNNKVDSLLSITNSYSSQRIMNNTEGGNDRSINENNLQLELSNNTQAILYQNEPNPFSDNTVIRYFIPEDTKGDSYIVFYDMYGKEIKRAEINAKGFGNINANTANLASGIYSYSIIINNNVIDTKKMMRNK